MKCRNKLESNQCRTCYNATKGLKLLTNLTKCCGIPPQKSYAELITEVSSINIMENSKKLPKFICGVCSKKLKAARSFIQQTREINDRLMAMLTDQEQINNEFDCLQEAQVDIQSCLEIKMENDDTADTKYHVKLKSVRPEAFLQSGIFDTDVLCEMKKDEKMNIVEHVTLDKNKRDLKLRTHDMENENDIALTKDFKGDILKADTHLFEPNEDVGDTDDDGVDGNQETEADWQKHDIFQNKIQKKISKNVQKPEEVLEKPAQDEDVAVPCSQCNKIFANSKALARHQRTSHIPEDQKCTCPLCFRKFSRSCNMYTHMRTFHGSDTVPLIRKPSTLERVFQCDQCHRNYTKKKHLNIHVKNKHSQENEYTIKKANKSEEDIQVPKDKINAKNKKSKRYEIRSLCSICGSSFSSKTHLIVHMRRHTGERPFKCDLCDRAYPRISELTCHRRIHTGEKPFACKICGKTFRVSSKMTTHMRSHTDIRPYKCTQCERSFKYSKDLSIHFRIHTGERPYSCNVCGSTFTQSNTLKAHRAKLSHMDFGLENTNN